MRLVNDNGEGLATLGGNLVEDERKLLHRRDDDLLPLLNKLAQIARVLGVTHRRAHLHKLFDGLLDLVIENAPVGNDDHRVEHILTIALHADELVRKPRDGVRLTATRRVLNQITLASTIGAHIIQRLPYHAELMVAWKHLAALFFACFDILRLDDLGVILEDVGQSRRCEHLFPQIIGLKSIRVGRIARAIVVALVERQKPRTFALKLCTHFYFAIVHREVHHTAPESKQWFARITVAAVLLHRVLHRLLGEAVLQLERGNGQTVDEQSQIERAACLVVAVGELARDREAVLGVQRLRLGITLRGRTEEEIEVTGGMVLDALAQYVDDAALADLGRETC